MKIIISQTAEELGRLAASKAAGYINAAVAEKGAAHLLVSTGASQFTTFTALLKEDVDWRKVEMFHLDEYIGLPQGHRASFIKYLMERFTDHIPLKAAHFIDVWSGVESIIESVSAELSAKPIDVGIIGVGENGHIAFNDPPADFNTDAAFKVVRLDDACRRQQLGEGWFPTLDDVPGSAVTMSVKQILKCKRIISAVPYKVKAEAVYKTLTADKPTPLIPATALRTHPDAVLLLDVESASMLDLSVSTGQELDIGILPGLS